MDSGAFLRAATCLSVRPWPRRVAVRGHFDTDTPQTPGPRAGMVPKGARTANRISASLHPQAPQPDLVRRQGLPLLVLRAGAAWCPSTPGYMPGWSKRCPAGFLHHHKDEQDDAAHERYKTEQQHPAAEVRIVEPPDREGQGRNDDRNEPDGGEDEPDHHPGAGDAGAIGSHLGAGGTAREHDDVQYSGDDEGDEHPPPVFAPAGPPGECGVLLEKPADGCRERCPVVRRPEWRFAALPGRLPGLLLSLLRILRIAQGDSPMVSV